MSFRYFNFTAEISKEYPIMYSWQTEILFATCYVSHGAIIGLFKTGERQQSCKMDIFIFLWVFRWKPWGRLKVPSRFTSEAPLLGLPLTLLRERHGIREDVSGKKHPWEYGDDLAAKPQRREEEFPRDEKGLAQFTKSLTEPNLQTRSAAFCPKFCLTQGPVISLFSSISNRDLKLCWNENI